MSDDAPTAPINEGSPDRRSNGPPRREGSPSAPGLAPGTEIGRFTVRRVLGEGGFGIVYEAQQNEPVRRLVALKVIKPGMDSKAVLARFAAERQALAVLDHPGVARVFDGGTTPEGRPFFAMELVRGDPLTEHCDRQRLSIRDRLDLFVKVCDAVQHAHSKGVIHRDLKPANILVAYEDGVASPKVIDFGIAKALDQRLAEHSVFTQQGQIIGTPEYMSPEQAEMGAQDIDTRSDVYSLGVILYELLTGARPFEPETLRAAAYVEMQRIIRDVEPPRPSTRLSSLATADDDQSLVYQSRRAEPRTLSRLLRRDLDWVVMRCLEKDRERRYDTPSALAEDVRRYQQDRPVEAGPPSAAYRVQKFVRRNRTPVAATFAFLVLLIGGLAGTAFGLLEAQRSARIAESESEISAAVAEYFETALGAAAPDTLGVDVALADVLDDASDRAGEQFSDRPAIEAGVRAVLGKTWLQLGAIDRAETEFRRSLGLHESIDGPDSDRARDVIASLVEVLWRRGQAEEAEALSDRLVDTARRVEGERSIEFVVALDRRASSLKYVGRDEQARIEYERSLEIRRALGADDTADAHWTRFNLALLDLRDDEFDSALRTLGEVEARARAIGGTARSLASAAAVESATIMYRQGELDAARPRLASGVAEMREVFGDTHWRTREAIVNLASLSARTGDATTAEELYREVLPGYRRLRGRTHPHTILITNRLARLVHQRGATVDACVLARTALDDLELDTHADPSAIEAQRGVVAELCPD